MPKTMISIPDRGYTIDRAIVRGVCKDLIEKQGLPKDMKLIFEEYQGAAKKQGNWAKICEDEGILTDYGNYMFISYQDRYTENGTMMHYARQVIHNPLYLDPDTGIIAGPYYGQKEFEISIRLRFVDLTRMMNWQTTMRSRDTQGSTAYQHHLYYDYDLPQTMLAVLGAAATLKLGANATPEMFQEHYKKTFVKGIKTRSNLNGGSQTVIAVESQRNIFAEPSDLMYYNEKTAQEGIWEVSFSYTFKCMSVLGCKLFVPAIVNNTPLPQWMVNFMQPKPRSDRQQSAPVPGGYLNQGALDTLQGTFDRYYTGDGGFRAFEWDDWYPTKNVKGTTSVSIIPITVDVDNPTAVFNISDLSTEMLPEAALNYLKAYSDRAFTYRKSLLQMSFYRISQGVEDVISVISDVDGNITTSVELNPMDRHYVRFYLQEEMSTIDNLHIEDLKRKPDLFIPFLHLYDPTFEVNTDSLRPKELSPNFTSKSRVNILWVPNNAYLEDISFTQWLRRYKGTSKIFKNMKYTFRPQVMHGRLGVK